MYSNNCLSVFVISPRSECTSLALKLHLNKYEFTLSLSLGSRHASIHTWYGEVHPIHVRLLARLQSRPVPCACPGVTAEPCALNLAQALREVVELVRCATDREAINLGIWLHETLALMARWRVSPANPDLILRALKTCTPGPHRPEPPAVKLH